LKYESIPSHKVYPFNIPAFTGLETIELKRNMTFFVGENGSGKSTFMEAIAYKCDFNPAGGGRNNIGVARALEEKIGFPLCIPVQPQLTGALGAALIALENVQGIKNR
jgi:predicted ATPase